MALSTIDAAAAARPMIGHCASSIPRRSPAAPNEPIPAKQKARRDFKIPANNPVAHKDHHFEELSIISAQYGFWEQFPPGTLVTVSLGWT
jgi:hypothetical protein